MKLYTPGFTIGEFSARTGVGVPTLRAWEERHGFPVPERLPGGHRRYSERDLQAVWEVLREREQGVTLRDALARARDVRLAAQSSIAATLRRVMADVPRMTLSRRSMIAVSHAIEDEAAGCVDRPIMIGAFQQEGFWRPAMDRWADLSSTSALAVALAASGRVRHDGALWQIPLPAGSPLAREWAVICDGPSLSVCVVATERPGGRVAARGRTFEALWTMEPPAVREAARAAIAVAAQSAPSLREVYRDRLDAPAPGAETAMRATTRLTNRILGYLETAQRGP
jgi:DNA-binding transcriptional MerR regulator